MDIQPKGRNAAVVLILVFLLYLPAYAADEPEKGYEISFAKGSYLIETGEYTEAIANLKNALQFKPGDKAATRSLGIAYSRSGDFQNARALLAAALDLDKSDRRTLYELGIVYYGMKSVDLARTCFTQVAAGGVEDELTVAAKRYLDILAARAAGPFAIDILAGLQYDTNVILEPSNPVGPGEKKSDWRAVVSANAAYSFVKSDTASAQAGYAFYQSVHNELHEFNVQQHSVSVGGQRALSGGAQAGALYRYTYAYVGGHGYSGIHQLIPSVRFALPAAQAVDVYYAFESRSFFDNDDFPRNSDRDGTNNAGGVTYTVAVGRGVDVVAGYAYDRDAASASWWSGTGQKVSAGASGDFSGIRAFLNLSFYDKRYEGVQPGFTDKRHDQVQEVSLNLDRKLTKALSLDVSELYTRNRSNLGLYDYTRNIVGLFAVMSL